MGTERLQAFSDGVLAILITVNASRDEDTTWR